jgi:hypothetical protein
MSKAKNASKDAGGTTTASHSWLEDIVNQWLSAVKLKE